MLRSEKIVATRSASGTARLRIVSRQIDGSSGRGTRSPAPVRGAENVAAICRRRTTSAASWPSGASKTTRTTSSISRLRSAVSILDRLRECGRGDADAVRSCGQPAAGRRRHRKKGGGRRRRAFVRRAWFTGHGPVRGRRLFYPRNRYPFRLAARPARIAMGNRPASQENRGAIPRTDRLGDAREQFRRRRWISERIRGACTTDGSAGRLHR